MSKTSSNNNDIQLNYLAGCECESCCLGKFQMMVLPQSGHAVHEDHPDKVECFSFTVGR